VAHNSGLTNSGKKEERQFNQILDKAVKEGSRRARHRVCSFCL